MEFYELTIKKYPDGTTVYSCNQFSEFYSNFNSGGSSGLANDPDPLRSAYVSYKRSVKTVFDLVHSNTWQYFFTLTLDPKKVDRYDYEQSSACIHRFTDLLYRSECLYVIVPEKHKDGAWHFHGLLANADKLKLRSNDNGYLEFTQYKYGYTSIDYIRDSSRAGNYILKYMVKGYNYLDFPKGKKRYWASRGLQRPVLEYDVVSADYIQQLLDKSYYTKVIDTDFYHGYIIECKE